jgi:predicted permease
MKGLLQDLGYARRQLSKNPGFTAIVVLTLALGMGANTAVFSVMNAVLLRMLPVRDPQRLYYVHEGSGQWQPPSAGSTGSSDTSFSEPVFEALRQREDVLEDLIAYVPLGLSGKTAIRYKDMPEEAEGDEVSGNFFPGLSARIVSGRGFSLADENNHSPVVVISYDYWTRRFGRDPSVLGQTLYIKDIAFSIVGITAHGFRGIEPASSTDFWIPLQNRPELNAWGMPASGDTLYGTPRWWCLRLMARLRPDVTPVQAQNALQSTFGEAAKIGIGTIDPRRWKPLLDFVPAKGIEGYNQQYRKPMQMLMGLVLLVLLIACTNVALLLLARNEARQREFSLRVAIGAEKVHLFRQLFSESALLVAAGAALGWVFAIAATRALSDWSGIESGLEPDRNVLLFTLGISILGALVFGLAPLWVALRSPAAGVLRATTAGVTRGRHSVMRSTLLMSSQVAICLLLLVVAGLLLRTLRNYETQDLGLQTDGLLVFGVTPQTPRTPQETSDFYRALLVRIRNLPGVEGATMMDNRIGSGWSNNNDDSLDGINLVVKFGDSALIRSNDVGSDYFHVLGVPIIQGRDISDVDTPTSIKVAVVNETFAKRFLPNTNPLGHRLRDNRTIVGVVKDSKYTSVDEPTMPMAYYAIQDMFAGGTVNVEVRAHGDPLRLLPTIRRAVAEIDPGVPLESPMTQRAQFELSYSEPKMFARLGEFFGLLASLLVATGLFGTSSYRTRRRTTEIGMRMAFGAQRRQVLWMVLRESVLICSIGVAVGLPVALLSVRLLSSMLYQLSPFDPVSFALATFCVVLVGGGAALLPASRAAKVDPMVALRYE